MFYLFLFLNGIFLVLRLIYIEISPFDLSPEEAQYWDWARHLDFSYYSKPPLIAYVNWLSFHLGLLAQHWGLKSFHLFLNPELVVRFNSAFFGFLISLLVFLTVKEITQDEKKAFFIGILSNLIVGFNALSFLFTTDTLLFFFWGFAFLLLLIAVKKKKGEKWAILLGLAIGLGLLSKYTMLFFIPLMAIYLYLKGGSRKFFIISSLSAFVLFLPVLYWNYLNDWVSFRHVLGLSGLEGKHHSVNVIKTFSNFLISQIFIMSVAFFPFLVWGWLKNISPQKKFFSLTLFSLPIYVFFQLLTFKKFVYGNWAGFAYFTGGILAGLYFLKFLKPLNFYKFFFTSLLAFIAFFINLIAFYPPLLDKIAPNLLPPQRDPTRVMIGWKYLAQKVSSLYNPEKDFIFSNLYQISAEMAFYVKGHPHTVVFNYYQRMNQYDIWYAKNLTAVIQCAEKGKPCPSKYFQWEKFKGKDGIFISYFPTPPKAILDSFENLEKTVKVEIKWRNRTIKVYYIHKLKNFKGNYEPIIVGF